MEITQEIKDYTLKVLAKYGKKKFNNKISLKEVALISDVDAVKICEFCNKDVKDTPLKIKIGKSIANFLFGYFNLGQVADFDENISIRSILFCYQFLQDEGYDLPQYLLGGKTLQESGLAIYQK